jgi:cell division protease FtsH
MTVGFAGADLANVINEAALLAARRGCEEIGSVELQDAVERVVAGLEKKNRVLRQEEKERVAHHEVGHALVALMLPGGETVHKISIIPRGISALGYTLQVPTEERFLMTKAELENTIAALLGGRVAEELIFHDLSTGARNDLLKATDIAKNMVKSYGMSEQLGQVSFEGRQTVFLQTGQGFDSGEYEYSEATAREIDVAVRCIIETEYVRATHLLTAHLTLLRDAAQLLLRKETMSGEELEAILYCSNGQANHKAIQAAAVY